MKNLSPRQQKILNLLTQKGDLTIAEIRQLTGISQATAYREVQTLAQAGIAQKTPGGLSLLPAIAGLCLHCHRLVNSRLVFYLEQPDGERRAACCAHCGLLALNHLPNTQQATTTDFLYGSFLNAAHAWYVLQSTVAPCCQPSVLAFGQKTDAERFATGFGGQVCDFTTAQKQIALLMSLHQTEHHEKSSTNNSPHTP
ncbi:MAG: hypothetical protein DDG60_01625 [Anaerolineae bacterium]|nr:MAG: hypothetical protein DDG60_01625 [Anaerolineae bacterium]